MTPTLDYIKTKFDEFNQLCFEGKLQPLLFKLSNARTFLGQVSFFQEKNPDDTWHYYGFTFRINTKIDLPEDVIEDTIIHEMIHYWILSNQMQDTSAHGELFMQKMQEINVKHNRNISVSHKVTKEEHDKDTEKRQHMVCVSRLRNGKMGVTIATRSSLYVYGTKWQNYPMWWNKSGWLLMIRTSIVYLVLLLQKHIFYQLKNLKRISKVSKSSSVEATTSW